MTNNRRSQETRTEDHSRARATNGNSIRFNDLPRDVLYAIVSKLPPKEFAKTSILSSEWESMWSTCPRLTFDAVTVCKCDRDDLHKHTGKFINEVNAVLQKHQDKVVETLEVRIDFVNSLLLADHINNWVDFAVSSRTKNLTLDLKPKRFWEYDDRYVFPFQLFDGGSSMSHIRHMQLSFVSLDPPSHFRGFPNLRKLHLQNAVCVNGKDLEHVLSRCCNLEWLHIDRCDLKDELIVDGPLTHLLYLRVEFCEFITKIKFHAANLATFEYDGPFIPIDLTNSMKLQSANIELDEAIFQHALASLLNGFPSVLNLTLQIGLQSLEKQWLWDNPLKFYNLRRLNLSMLILKDLDKVLYSFLFLRATPFIEKLEVNFAGSQLWLAEAGPCRKDLGPPCKYNYLKNICITGFKAARGQIELLLHLVENAPALEVINIKVRNKYKEFWPYKGSRPPLEEAKRIARNCLNATLPLNVKFDVIV